MGFFNKISTNTIFAFASGIIFTVFFNLIVNKEPFKIDSDSISSLANVGTFVVAIIAALQVKRWLNNKINDKAFKQTEKVLEYIEDLHTVLEPLRSKLTLIENGYKFYGLIHLNNDQKNEIYDYCNNINSFTEKLVMSTLMLKYWNSKLTETSESKIDELASKLRELVYSTAPLLESNSDNSMKEYIDQTSNIYLSAIKNLREILSLNYDEMFTHNVTSPSKKVD